MYLYKITNNINNKIYIGITNNYKKRWSNHGNENSVISRAIQKYGKSNFTFEVLFENVPLNKIDDLEKEQIQKYNSLVPNGYNVLKGGRYNGNKGKARIGVLNGRSLLTENEVRYIKNNRNKPIYVLYEEFSSRITYAAFKNIYKNKTYKNIIPTVNEYPYNSQFSGQFSSKGKLSYDEVCSLRIMYKNGIYWKDAYSSYKELYPNEIVFWKIYTGRQYSLVMPEVFTEENKRKHKCLGHKGEKNGKAKLTTNDVVTIRELYKNGETVQEIKILFPQVSSTAIKNIIKNKTWKIFS